MSLFDDASLILTPNGFKTSKDYSLKPFDGSGDLTVVRNTSATRVNESGLIELVGNNVPRIDWSSGEPSILVEPQRTNLISNSNVFQGGFYNSVGRMTLNNNAGISPDGTNNAVEVVPTNENNAHYFRNGSSTYSNGNNYCYSMYFKNVNFENERIVLQVLSKQVFLEFDNNNVLSIQIGGSLPLSNAKLVDYGNGWYRVSIFWSESSGYKYTGVSTENDQDGTKSFLVYGSQLEEGSYPTSYIPTSGSVATRNADLISKTGISSLINSTEGTLFVHLKALSNSGNSRRITLSDGTISNRVSLELDEVQNRIKLFINSQVLQFDVSNILNYTKIACLYKSNDYSLWVNGIKVDELTTIPTTPSNLSVFSFDGGNGSNKFEGEVKSSMIFPRALTDAECQSLTN